jgi:formylglycine-generating enzyme required for sulfatase activity
MKITFIFAVCLAYLSASGLHENVALNEAGVLTARPEKVTPFLLTYVSDQLTFEHVASVDIDPKAFDYTPKDDEETNADYASIKFITRLLKSSQGEDVAAIDRAPLDQDSEFDKEQMYYVPGARLSVQGRINDYDRMPVSTLQRDGVTVIANYPRENVLPTVETPSFNSLERGFYIDQRPVSNGQYKKFVKATKRNTPDNWVNGNYPSGERDAPVVDVSFHDAVAYAAWAGKRLPTYSEFERANRKFPLRSSVAHEWSTTQANPGHYPAQYFLFGGGYLPEGNRNTATGFRTAVDDR